MSDRNIPLYAIQLNFPDNRREAFAVFSGIKIKEIEIKVFY